LCDSHTTLRESNKKLRGFILSDRFLLEFIQFEHLLGDFQDKVITLVEIVQTPQPGLAETKTGKEETEEETEETEEGEKGVFTTPKAIIVAITMVASIVAVDRGLIPPVILTAVVFTSIGLMFLPQIRSVIAGMLHREEEDEGEAPSMKLEDWINESLSRIRDLYTSARFLTKVQDQTKETVPYYGVLGMDEALYDRRKYFNETLPSEFLSRIGKIMVACDKNVWARKSLLVNAITLSRQATAKAT